MQENSMDPVPLSQLLRESYLAEARAHHKHNEISPDLTSSQGLHYKSLKGKPEDSESQREPQIPDLSAFLSQEELDKSVDLARQAISHEPNMQVESQTVRPHIGSNTTPPTTEPTPEKTEVDPTHASGTNMIERQSLESPIQCNVMQNNGTLGGPHSDLKRPAKTTPYGVETQSKKEFLNKAADFIEELSSLFKANSSKRVRPRSCKAHRSRNQNKAQGSSVPFPLNEDDRERSVLQISQQINPPIIQPTSQLEELTEIQTQESRIPEEPLNPEAVEEFIPSFEAECATPELMESQCLEEPLCEPPHFIQKLKSREVPEGSKVQLDCIVHGFPLPEVRWFCEGKELENSPDIQILNNEEHHSLIISEAFEEDTGRYSCFASNFYGTDSTSAEIYVEGASSSDSEGEQHFETQKIKKVAETSATLPSVATPQPLSVEVADPVPEPVSTESTHSTSSTLVTDSVPSLLPSQEVTVLVPDKVSSVQPPAKEESPASPPPEEVTPVIPETETAAQPSNPSPQEILISLPANIQHNHIENHSSDHIITPQVLEGRPTMAAPVFTKSLQDLVAHESQLVVLECRVKGVPSPKVDWYREGTAIEDSPDFRILQKKPRSMIESEEICTLVIAEVFPEDSGTFTCTASNKYGTISSIASLKVKGTKNNHEILANQTVQQDLISSSLKRKPEPSLVNSKKLFSSMPHLDPLNCHSPLQDPFCSNALGLNSINSNTSHKDTFTTSLQNLNLSKYLTLPQLDSLGISEQDGRSLISPPHKSRNQDSLGSGFTPSHKIQIPLNGPATVDGCEPGPSSSVEQSFISQSGETAVPNAPGDAIPKTTKLNRASCNHHESLSTVPLPDPPSSCLKTRPEGGLLKHNEPRSSSRVGLRVTFKLPEDEEEERRATSWSKSMEDLHPGLVNKEPPPVLAKPKLDPKQLQILHEQVLLEQQQDVPPPNHQEFSWPQMSSREPQPPNSLESKPASTLTPVMNSSLAPKQKNTSDSSWSPLPTPQINSTPVPRTNMVPSSQPIIQQPPSSLPQVNNIPMSVASTPPLPILNMGPSVTVPQLHTSTPLSQPNQAARTPIAQLSVASLIPIHQPFIDTSIPAAKMNIAPTPQMLPLNTDPTLELNAKPNAKLNAASYVPSNQLNTMPMPQLNTYPSNHMVTTSMTQMSTTSPPQMTPSSVASVDVPVPTSLHVNFSANPSINSTPLSENSIPATQLNVAPKPLRNANSSSSSNAPDVSLLSKVPSPSLHNKPIPPVLRTVPSHLQNSNQAPLTNIALDSSINSSSGFNYTRPKEFIAAQNMSPVRSPSPTQSPVPMLLEMAAQISPRPSRVTSPLNHITQTGSAFPTRNLESPSSQVMLPPALMNSMFALRSQSPPQASSPTSSTSSPSPIQNPVAFLSSVLPSLPTSPPTNAMGLPKSAPATLPGSRRNSRSLLSISDDFRDAKETLIQDIEKKLRIKDEPTHYGQQEFKVSNFEQRLMSEIEFRLERTPVEESDEEIHHDEIPTGKCIAPIFDKKLRNYRAYEGIPVTFTCKVVGIPLPKIYWFKDGKQILSKNTHYRKLREGDGTCSLHIEVATNDDDGNYTVMAANPQGRASCSGHLIVQTGQMRNRPVISQRVRARVQEVEGEPAQERFFKPHFLQAPGDIVCHEGKLCRLDCKVNGSPPPDLMWLVNGRPIYSDFHHRLLVRENGIHSLVIDPLSQSHAGTYTCIASNKAGQSSFSLEIKVVEREIVQAPYFIEKLQNTGIAEGSPVRLECRVVGMPPPIIYWKKDNETIPHSKERMTMHQDTTGYVCLVIQPTRKDDAGWYAVSAKNEAGVISCTARLDIYAQWYQQVHPPMKKLQHTGSRYPTLLSQGLSIKSGYSSNDIYSSCREDGNHESEEL